MRKQKVFLGVSEEEVQSGIAKWVAADPSILILNKSGKLVGSGDWEATVEYEELSCDAQRVTGRPLG